MKNPLKKKPTKITIHHTHPVQFASFVLMFGVLGTALILKSLAATPVGRIEAESMVATSGTTEVVSDSGASNGQAIKFSNYATASGTITLTNKATDVIIRARGDICKGAPQASLLIDGKQAASASVSSNGWTDYSSSFALTSGSHSLALSLTNPLARGKCSRNLYVDTVSAIDNTPAPAADTTAPATSISSPAGGSTVSGVVQVGASASDNVAVTKVELYVDNALLSSVTASPYNFSWDTTKVTNAGHSLVTKAYDAAGNSASSASVSVTVTNQTATTTTSPSGTAVPSGDLTVNGHTWHQIVKEDFTKDAPLGSWNDNGTLTSCGSDYDAAKYTGATGVQWASYPKCFLNTDHVHHYRPDQTLSVHDGVLDYWLHTVDGSPTSANPSPILPGGSRYQTYGRYEVRFKTTSMNLSEFYVAWLLWPNDGDSTDQYRAYRWNCAESDFPESNLGKTSVNAFAHYDTDTTTCADATRHQDYYNAAIDYTGWHTYTQEWLPGKRNYYLDGNLVGSSTNYVYSKPQRWQLQTEVTSSCDSTTPNTCTQDGHLLLDWATVYAY